MKANPRTLPSASLCVGAGRQRLTPFSWSESAGGAPVKTTERSAGTRSEAVIAEVGGEAPRVAVKRANIRSAARCWGCYRPKNDVLQVHVGIPTVGFILEETNACNEILLGFETMIM